MPIRPLFRTALHVSLASALLLSACATRPPASDKEATEEFNERNDPLEPSNRFFYKVNNTLDKNVLHPVASGYRDVVPDTVRTHVHNTLSNLGNPAQLVNDVLQGKPRKAGNTFMRLLLNTTAGVGGVFDVATGLGFPDHDTDFGLTLAVWGVPGGPFLFLPVLGPSNPRDGVGYGVNSALDPLSYLGFPYSKAFGYTRFGVGAVDSRARVLDETDSIDKTALDPYATYRSLYQQHRDSAIEDARSDLKGTVPNWYSDRTPQLQPAGGANPPPVVAPRLAPPPAQVP